MVDLLPGIVHLWLVDLDRPEPPLTWLSDDERLRAAAFRFETPRHRFVAGRGALRRIIGRYLGEPPEALCFSYGAQGKPDLGDRIQFNLAHSGAQMLLAVAATERLGVDLEAIRPVPNLAVIAATYLPVEEVERLRERSGTERVATFLRAWTRMEALAKLDGAGVSKSHMRLLSQRAHIQDLKPLPGYIGALATDRPIRILRQTMS